MVTEDYVSFKTAKLLKEKGFDEATNRYYNAQYDQIRTVSDTFMWHWNNEEFMKKVLMDGAIAIPTLQMAMKWLREVHRIETHIALSELNADNSRKYMFDIFSSDVNKNFDSVQKEGLNSYEEACEAAIKYCLKNLI